MNVFILFNDLHKSTDSSELKRRQYEVFSELDTATLESLLLSYGGELKAEHYPHEYDIFLSNETKEHIKKVCANEYEIVYCGDGSDFRELLMSMFFVMSHMSGRDQVIFFIKKLGIEMKNINKEAAIKLERMLKEIKEY